MSSESTRKASARRVFVSNLSLITEFEGLKLLMELAGEVTRVELLEDFKRHKKRAIVAYSSSLEAQRAVQQLDGKELDGRTLEIHEDNGTRRSRSPRKTNQIYVKNLPYSVTWQQLRDVFISFGEILRVDIPKDSHERSKGFGFILFKEDNAAMNAMESMNNAEFNGRRIVVKRAQRKHRKQGYSNY